MRGSKLFNMDQVSHENTQGKWFENCKYKIELVELVGIECGDNIKRMELEHQEMVQVLHAGFVTLDNCWAYELLVQRPQVLQFLLEQYQADKRMLTC